MSFRLMILPLAAAGLIPAGASAQGVVKYTLPASKDGKPARILESTEVPSDARTLYVSGQVASPIDPARGAASIADLGDTKTQALSAFAKIEKILKGHGYAMSDVVKVTLFVVADPRIGKMDMDGANAAFDAYFNTPANPTTAARSTVQVAGLAGPYYLVEVEVVAAKR